MLVMIVLGLNPGLNIGFIKGTFVAFVCTSLMAGKG